MGGGSCRGVAASGDGVVSVYGLFHAAHALIPIGSGLRCGTHTHAHMHMHTHTHTHAHPLTSSHLHTESTAHMLTIPTKLTDLPRRYLRAGGYDTSKLAWRASAARGDMMGGCGSKTCVFAGGQTCVESSHAHAHIRDAYTHIRTHTYAHTHAHHTRTHTPTHTRNNTHNDGTHTHNM